MILNYFLIGFFFFLQLINWNWLTVNIWLSHVHKSHLGNSQKSIVFGVVLNDA